MNKYKLYSKRLDDLRLAETRRVNGVMKLHSQYDEKLNKAEAKRLDAIRSVDVNALQNANDRAASQAQVLAKNVTESAETLRQLVATTANQVAEQLKSISTQLADRLLIVEKAQYESKGKSGVTSPLLMLIAGLAGGIIVFIIESLMKK